MVLVPKPGIGVSYACASTTSPGTHFFPASESTTEP